ncbi:tRNA lysidine(34) synthetase TilS [Mucilaginibacter sp. Bleaf8]|uniref:tRNA lysidine(34) synthetase TilS n=1 Tax=Mucilaginibacter sp. Bleaf8 TaxID=2834430 RepID=UPI001BCF1DB6|nr:tRNA lysidine(34) synthetase TilS [Mucilaginibacter sp. Bleaf8]MBS7564452.1 tRNA lysidine(34) synthetase TilS [Mucilaginibacter sp. Bleaf8]
MLPVDRFNSFIQQHQLLDQQSRILAAVSGGMDSVLMVHLLRAAGYTFGLAHCNFQLRGSEADADQQFCRQLAETMQVPFYTVNFDTGAYAREHRISIQMAARELRYQWFEQTRQLHQYDAITLAHHQNDTIETILLNLTRGTGIAGLHGIMPKNGNLVRPLLFLTRQEVADMIAQNALPYVEDSSNASTKYARNKIRHDVVPKLRELNPNLEATFQRNLNHFKELEVLLNAQLVTLRNKLLLPIGNEIHIAINEVKQLHPQHLLLHGLLKAYGFNETTVDDVISALSKHAGRRFESLHYSLLLDRESLILAPKTPPQVAAVSLSESTQEVIFHNYTLRISTSIDTVLKPDPMVAMVDAGLLTYPLTLRTWQQGDYFIPLGMPHRKKLSDFFVNQKIPLLHKSQVPLLVNGNGDVIWVGGYRLDNRYKVTPQTKKVAIFELLKS